MKWRRPSEFPVGCWSVNALLAACPSLTCASAKCPSGAVETIHAWISSGGKGVA